jgi:predicted dehydrogenase
MRAAVIGMGRMGQRHVEALSEHSVVGVADLREEALAEAAEGLHLSGSVLFRDGAEMVQRVHPDLLVVATTTPSHRDLVCMGADEGTPFVLVEKPMAASVGECREMIRRCRDRGVRLAVNHQMRYMQQYRLVKERLIPERLGGLSSMTVVCGNFGIAMNGTHYFEAFRYLTDEPPVTVAAWLDESKFPNPRGPQFGDWAGEVRVTSEHGHVLYLSAREDQGHGLTCVYSGPAGQAVVDELGGVVHWNARRREHAGAPTGRYAMPWERGEVTIGPKQVVESTRSLMTDLLAGGDYPTGEQGMLALSQLAAAVVSSRNGGALTRVGEDLDSVYLSIA